MSQTSEMTKPKIGEVGWNELITKDTQAASAFYGKLFGWQSTPFTPQGAPAGGRQREQLAGRNRLRAA